LLVFFKTKNRNLIPEFIFRPYNTWHL